MNPQTWNRYAYVNNNPLAMIDPLGLDSGNPCDDPWYAETHAECPAPPCAAFGTEGCIPFPPGYPGSGGGGGGGSPTAPSSSNGGPTLSETLGLPGGLNSQPFGNMWNWFGFLPDMPNPSILDFLESGVGGNGTPDSPWTYFVQVWAPSCRTWVDGDFTFSSCGHPSLAPPQVLGMSEILRSSLESPASHTVLPQPQES